MTSMKRNQNRLKKIFVTMRVARKHIKYCKKGYKNINIKLYLRYF